MSKPSGPRGDAASAQALQSLAADAESWTGDDVLERARRYVRDGRVHAIEVDGAGALHARVDGRRKTPYKVKIDPTGADPGFTCSCPYDDDPLCKHGAAALLTFIDGLEGELPPQRQARAARRRRARQESWTIRNVGGERYLSTFEVRGDSGRTYKVEIRDAAELINRCTCRDHGSNLLGTCKHIEAVLDKLRRRAPVKMEGLAEGPPAIGQLLVRWEGGRRVALRFPPEPSAALQRLRRRYFDADGFLSLDPDGDLADLLPKVIARAERVADVRVYDDIRELLDRERRDRRRAETARHVAAQLREGSLDARRDLGVRADLYPYQVEGVAFLAARGRVLLADDMGLGKTLQALAAFAFLRRQGHATRALVVCPTSLKHQWKGEAEHFTDLAIEVVEGPPHARRAQYRKRADLTVVNYELLLRDGRVAHSELAADLLILDEAQRIRNWRTKTAAAVKELDTEHAFVLTGTPLENRLEDLYSLMQVVDPELLGPLWSFRSEYTVGDAASGRVLGYRNLQHLRRRLAPALKRRTRADVLDDLPGLVVNRFRLELTEQQREIHDESEREIAMLAAISRRRKLTPAEEKRLLLLLNTCRLACNAASLLDKDWWQREHLDEALLDEALRWPKLRELRRLLTELCIEEAKKVVVFSEWRRMQRFAEAVAADLGLRWVSLHGGVPARRRGELVARFRDDPGCGVFFSTDAGGVGLNLQAADAVVLLDLPWNPAALAQRIARVHRHGQKGSVHVLQLISRACLEERIERLLDGKQSLFDAALGASEVTEMARPSTSAQVVAATMEAYGIGEDGRAAGVDDRHGAGGPQPMPALASDRGGEEPAPPWDGQSDEATVRQGGQSDEATVRQGGEGGEALPPRGQGAVAAPPRDKQGDQKPGERAGSRTAVERRRRIADRQLEAAEVLAAAGLGGACLAAIYAAVRAELVAAIGELADDAGDVSEEPSHDWIVEHLHRSLVPSRVSLEQASLLGQARDLAGAFGPSTSVPAGLAQPLIERLEALRERLRGS